MCSLSDCHSQSADNWNGTTMVGLFVGSTLCRLIGFLNVVLERNSPHDQNTTFRIILFVLYDTCTVWLLARDTAVRMPNNRGDKERRNPHWCHVRNVHLVSYMDYAYSYPEYIHSATRRTSKAGAYPFQTLNIIFLLHTYSSTIGWTHWPAGVMGGSVPISV